jgi:hypothetical protein
VSDPNPGGLSVDPTAEGARARAQGEFRNLCPYASDTEECREWLEGYDGANAQGFPRLPQMKEDDAKGS